MKVAVLSDIHGNLTAFNAVLDDINKLGIDKIIIAGDHIMDCPQNNEVLEKIKTLTPYVIQGNREKYILDYEKGLHNEWDTHKQMAAVVWTYKNLNKNNIKYIDQLPEQLTVSLPEADAIRVVHGSPFGISEPLFPDKYPERLEKALKSINESVLICGHTHEAWSMVRHGKLVVNPGSVGVPFNKNKCADYAVLTLDQTQWIVSHHEVKYDLEELDSLFLDSGLFHQCKGWSELTLQTIKQGKDITSQYLDYAYALAEKRGFKDVKLIPNHIWDEVEQLWFSPNVKPNGGCI